jgi:hypothetical protein
VVGGLAQPIGLEVVLPLRLSRNDPVNETHSEMRVLRSGTQPTLVLCPHARHLERTQAIPKVGGDHYNDIKYGTCSTLR